VQRVDKPVILEWKITSRDPESISGRKVVKVLKEWPESFFVGLVKVQRFYWHLEMELGKVIGVWQDENGYAECSKVLD
jgi:hypothetical protein